MKTNVGKMDRVLRVVVGLVLLAAFFMLPEAGYRWLFLIGLVPLVTGLAGTCPLYAMFGISTCNLKN